MVNSEQRFYMLQSVYMQMPVNVLIRQPGRGDRSESTSLLTSSLCRRAIVAEVHQYPKGSK